MKGFIEVHDFNDGKEELINVEMIVSIKTTEEESTLLKATSYQNFNVRESYEEVKALIAEAHGDVDLKDYVSKKKLEEWIAFEENTLGKCKIIDMHPSEYSKMRNFLRKLRNFLKEEES